MNAVQVDLNSREEAGSHLPAQVLSALVDGKADALQLDALFAAREGAADVLASWHSYQVIGDVLRGDRAVAVVAQPPGDFLAVVRGRLLSERAPVALAMPQTVSERAPAANDALFRWQLVAGLASLAAVMAVSWTVMSGTPSSPGGAGPQLATAPAAAVTAAAEPRAPMPSTPVVVNTGQGTLIRDARLEELLAEHRQNGGVSALQMPTGFIRSATYDATGR